MISLSKSRLLITRLLRPIFRLISALGKPEPLCDDDDLFQILRLARPGYILLSKDNFRLSNLLISGFWSHAAIVLDGNRILEATPPKCRVVSFARFILSKDHICLLKPKFPFDYVDHSSDYMDKGYDFDFISGDETFYCSELVFDFLKKIAPQMPFVPRKTWGVETVIPDDFYKAKDKFDVIHDRRR